MADINVIPIAQPIIPPKLAEILRKKNILIWFIQSVQNLSVNVVSKFFTYHIPQVINLIPFIA